MSFSTLRLQNRGGYTKIAEDYGVSTGLNGYFDLALLADSGGNRWIEVFMKVQFFFRDGDPSDSGWRANEQSTWSDTEKSGFLTLWLHEIQSAWNDPNIGTLVSGKRLGIEFNFLVQVGGIMWDHFEIGVVKIPQSGRETSYVQRSIIDDDVHLDSEDLTPKPGGQIAAAHEFGHMIGLPDEYHRSSRHYRDSGSMMHAGTLVRGRHYQFFSAWAQANDVP